MVNESKKHISSPCNPLDLLQNIITGWGSMRREDRGTMLRGKCIVGFLYSFLGSNDHNTLFGMSTGILPASLTELLLESKVHGLTCYGNLQLLQKLLRKQMAILAWKYVERGTKRNGVLFHKSTIFCRPTGQVFFFFLVSSFVCSVYLSASTKSEQKSEEDLS